MTAHPPTGVARDSPPAPPTPAQVVAARRLTVARPRLLSDVLVAVAALVLLGVPSLFLAPDSFLPDFHLFRLQEFLGGESANPEAATVRAGVNAAAALGMPIALIWRASRPVHSCAAIALLALAHFFTGLILMPVDLVIFGSLYSITVYGSRSASRAGLFAALLGGLLVSLSTTPPIEELFQLLFTALVFVLSTTLVLLFWGAGLLRRSRLEQRETLRERARRLERERDQQAQIATVAERNRIAREMHDIVAHYLSVVVAQADGGRYAAASHPEAATKALETIAETSRAALADMRRILGVLREDGGESAELIPQPADTDIETLVAQVKSAGLRVSYVAVGTPRRLPPGAGVAVYRIVQESLTNILKHAGPHASAIVTSTWAGEGLTVTVDDDGRGAAAATDGAGHGLVGMRERATMLGGALNAGPKPGGGFRVNLHLPLPH